MTESDRMRGGKLTLEGQRRLLRACAKDGVHLSNALLAAGLTYDDLVYAIPQDVAGSRLDEGLELSAFETVPNSIPVVSFFSGAGGMDLGFEAAGFDHLGLFEYKELFCSTLLHNRPHWNVFGPDRGGDVSETDLVTAAVRNLVGSSREFDGVFVGGPPCQPFSIASNQRFAKGDDNYKRTGFASEKNGNLLFAYVDLIKEFRPAVFLIENVPGLLELDGGEGFKAAMRLLTAVGYHIENPIVLNASDFHVPQNRERALIVGHRLGASFRAPEKAARKASCGPILAKQLGGVLNHNTRSHSAESVARYMELGAGKRDQGGRVDRLRAEAPSKTIIAGGTSGGGRSHLHPLAPRTLSARECARLQTFPDDFVFLGPTARQFTQVGNAVPPVLAAQFGLAIRDSLFGARNIRAAA